MRRLTKRDAEALLRGYDDDPVAALSMALRTMLELDRRPGQDPEPSWAELVAAAPLADDRRAALVRADSQALDDLAAQLNEERLLET